MRNNRPVFLELWRIRLPVTGWVSFLHRVSGLLLVLVIPYAVYLLGLSLSGPAGYAQAADLLDGPAVRLLLLLLGWSLLQHLLAGVRFLLLDLGVWVDRPAARRSAWAALGAAVVLVLIGGGGLL